MPTGRGTARKAPKRVQLDRTVIVEAAQQLAASGEPITIRALGARLGVDSTAAYRHFRTRDEVVEAVFDRLLVAVVEQVDGKAPWRTRLDQVAQRLWSACEDHPTVGVEIHNMVTGGPGELAAVELVLGCFHEAGLDRSEAVRFYAVFSAHIMSVGASLADYRLRGSRDEEPARTRSWVGDLGPVDPQRYPAIAAARIELEALRHRDIYDMGVEVILDAAQAAARKAAAAP